MGAIIPIFLVENIAVSIERKRSYVKHQVAPLEQEVYQITVLPMVEGNDAQNQGVNQVLKVQQITVRNMVVENDVLNLAVHPVL